MTIDPSKLLQMLEPAVRPGTQGVDQGAQQGRPAFENRSFRDLLNEASLEQTGEAAEPTPEQVDPLAALGGLGQVENAGLRSVLAQARQAGQEPADNG